MAPSARVASLTRRPRFVESRPVSRPAADAGGKAAAAGADQPLARRARRPIEKTPNRYGEKPFEQMVTEAFEGSVLRLSRRMDLLESAKKRHIRRGDALDVIAAVKREIEAKHGARPATPLAVFAGRYAAFVAVYAVVALAWCLVVGAHS